MLIKDALQDEDGIKINGENITMIRYADDTATQKKKKIYSKWIKYTNTV